MSGRGFTIGQLARAAGVHVETVRYYQRLGLMPVPPRPLRGHRRYPPEALARLRFIKRAQRLGFTLAEVGELLRLEAGECAAVRALAQRRRADIEARIRDLQAMAAALERYLQDCERTREEARPCPLLARLGR